MAELDRGLDLSKPDETTTEEIEAFRAAYDSVFDRTHPGLNFWLEDRPDVLKRYRRFAQTMAPNLEKDPRVYGFPYLAYYALTGFDAGVRYVMRGMQRRGLTKSQCLEAIAIAFIHAGPRGMETISNALHEFEWIVPADPARFPDGWAPDPAAFASGLDFTTSDLSGEEMVRLQDWYMRTLGEIPRYVNLLGKYRPELLKAYRDRFENCCRELPKQVVPTTLIALNMVRGFRDGIREDVLLARAFGIARDDLLRAIGGGTLYGSVESISIVDEAAGDVLEHWTL